MHCFTNTPLLNEPGVTKKHSDYKVYNDIIEYCNYSVAIRKCINNCGFFNEKIWKMFENHVTTYIKDNKDLIISDFKEIIKRNIEKDNIVFEEKEDGNDKEIIRTRWCGMYSMKITFSYHNLLKGLERDIKTFLN